VSDRPEGIDCTECNTEFLPGQLDDDGLCEECQQDADES
jgi:hypothetical protein